MWSILAMKPIEIALIKTEYCEDIAKSKNTNRLKCLILLCYGVELCKTLKMMNKRFKSRLAKRNFIFGVKYAVFIKKEHEGFKNCDFCYIWSNDHMQ